LNTSRFTRRFLLLAAVAAAVGACNLAGTGNGGQATDAMANSQARGATQLVSSELEVVRAMLDLADVGRDDLVVDLGSGDGRIPIMAAREKGARGLGIEIDRDRIRRSNENARAAGVADRVQFRQQDLFVTPLNDVTVLTLYLLPEINLQLRPKILNQMRPGTRVVSNTWDMGDWRPDERRNIGGTNIFLWIVPARVEGQWRLTQDGQTADLSLAQRYQDLAGSLGGRPIAEGRLRGDRIAFTADMGGGPRRFEGRVEGDRIVGDGWEAVRTGAGS
jgi:SAM-dependent methyltransferase